MTIRLTDGDFAVQCEFCDRTARVRFTLQPDAVLTCVRELVKQGWHIGGEPDEDACPGCWDALQGNTRDILDVIKAQ